MEEGPLNAIPGTYNRVTEGNMISIIPCMSAKMNTLTCVCCSCINVCSCDICEVPSYQKTECVPLTYIRTNQGQRLSIKYQWVWMGWQYQPIVSSFFGITSAEERPMST
jgi:hypothetical protein